MTARTDEQAREDEGLTEWGMTLERDLDEADREAEQAWLEERP